MSGLIRKLENIYAAAAFGEYGEWKTAKTLVKDESPAKISLDRPTVGPRLRVWASKP
ncbi:MAG: hypothetical protein SVS15_03395 [Thermodesulfobacteriota bacterium]|nr:hypothetical protein [Thermodesulfobacteriota bacterium]